LAELGEEVSYVVVFFHEELEFTNILMVEIDFALHGLEVSAIALEVKLAPALSLLYFLGLLV
jgi:hypothetical protein